MPGHILFNLSVGIAKVTISRAGRFNAMSRLMWRELRDLFEHLQKQPDLRCVLISGEGGNFCAGGDISEYANFRFKESTLRDFHEIDVWGGLQAMLNCDVPIVAKIDGNCMGAGVEIASCCDIRIAGESARFGAPIARLGFPMAPREAALVTREVGLVVSRKMLLEAAVFSAADMKACGFLSQITSSDSTDAQAQACAQRIASLAPQAARLNKQTLRALSGPLACVEIANAYAYADSNEHREGIVAFLDKRPPAF